MWTTAGAIFSTTSAMKLNLYRALVSWWRPALAGRTRCFSEAQISGKRDSLAPRMVNAELPHLTSPGRPGGSERSEHLPRATQH